MLLKPENLLKSLKKNRKRKKNKLSTIDPLGKKKKYIKNPLRWNHN